MESVGFEPTASRLPSEHSTRLNYNPSLFCFGEYPKGSQRRESNPPKVQEQTTITSPAIWLITVYLVHGVVVLW